MNLKIQRADLLSALNSVAVALSSKSGNPYGSFVLMSAKADTITLTADSIQLRAETSVKCQSKSDGVVLISHSKLVALLQRQDESVELISDEKRLQVKVGSSVTHLPLMPVEGFPPPRNDGDQKAFVILDNQAFANSLAIVCPFAGNGVDHHWNTSLLIEDDTKNLTIAACDGKRFARILLPGTETPFKVIVPASLIQKSISAISASESLTMVVYERTVKFDTEAVSLQIQQADTGYPDSMVKVCERMNAGCKYSVTVDRARLISELQIAAAVLERDEDGVGIEVKTSPQSLVVSAKSKSSADHAEAIDTKATVALPRRRINHGNLIAHLRSLDCEAVTLYYEPKFEEPGFRISPQDSNAIAGYMGFFRDV